MRNVVIMKKAATAIASLLFLLAMPMAHAQLQIGDDLKMKVGGMFTAGYEGNYGNNAEIQSDHGLNFGFNGNISGSYYNPNFLSFNFTPYYNQSRADSDFQSLTGASGITGTANLFNGSHFPGSVTYHNDYNSTGTFGLVGEPNFTTHGHGEGLGVGWSALIPGWPTLSLGFSEGSGSGTVYGANEESGSSTKLFNVRSTYSADGFHMTGFVDHNTLDATYPAFIAGEQESVSDTVGHDFGASVNRNLPLNGSVYTTYTRSEASTDFQGTADNTTSYTTSTETSGANFRPTKKLSVYVSQSYTDNLAGFLTQNVTNTTTVSSPLNLGTGSNSLEFGGGATYLFTNFFSAQGQATYYDQHYFDKTYTGTYISGTLNYSRRILDTFSFSAGVVESSNGQGSNAIGFVGNVNYFHRIKGWETSGNFSYAQNVQSVLITYTTSYYSYTARLRRRLGYGLAWIAAYNGSQSGLTQQPGSGSHSEGYTTSLSSRRFALTGNYTSSSGQSLLTSAGLVALPPTPGVPASNLILFNGDSWGGGISTTPVRRLTIAATFSRALSDTMSSVTDSRNSTEIYNAQLQYHLRRIGVQAGFTSFTQGISASGLPAATANSYFIGVSRWFDFF